MQNNEIHRIFEDKLDKLVFDKLSPNNSFSTENEWESLSKRLANHKKMTLWKKYGIAAGILSLSVLLFLFINTTTTSNHSSSNPIVENKTTAPQNNTNTSNTNSTFNQITNNNPTVNSEIIGNENKSITTTTTINDKKESSANSSYNALNRFESELSNTNFNEPSSKGSLTSKKNTNNSKANTNNKKGSNKPTIIEKDDSDLADNQKETAIDNETVSDDEKKGEMNIDNAALENKIANVEATPIPVADKAIIGAAQPVLFPKKKKATRELPTHDFIDSKTWYVEAFSGMTSSKKNVNSFAAFLAPAGYTDMRLKQESNLSTITAGVNFKVRQKHITFSSGLHYMQLGDNIKYDTAFNSNSLVLSANGKTQFTYIEVPFLAGYEWANKRWGFNLQGGISAGILSKLSGNYVSINNFNTQLFNVADNQKTFRNAVFNLLISPQVSYYFNANSNIFITPNYRRNLQPITVAGSDLTQKYSVWGIQIGVRTRIK